MISSVALRIASMASRFILLITLVSKSPVAVVADYGVLAGLIATASYLLGFDLYIQTSRNARRPGLYNAYLSNQVVFFAIGAILVCAFVLLVPLQIVDTVGPGALLALVGTDLAMQEVARLLLGQGRYQLTNVVQFMRLGLWPIAATVDIVLRGATIVGIVDLLPYWLTVNALGAILGLWLLKLVLPGFRFRPSRRLFRAGLARQCMIFSSSIVLLLFAGVDRVVLSLAAPSEYVAAYVFFGSVFGVILTLVYSGLINPYYSTFSDRSTPWVAKRGALRKFALAALGFVVGMLAVLLLGIDFLLRLLDRPEYSNLLHLKWWFAVFVLVSVGGLIPHFFLFALRRDRDIAIAGIAAVAVFIVSYSVANSLGMADAMPLTICLSATSLAVAKTCAALAQRVRP